MTKGALLAAPGGWKGPVLMPARVQITNAGAPSTLGSWAAHFSRAQGAQKPWVGRARHRGPALAGGPVSTGAMRTWRPWALASSATQAAQRWELPVPLRKQISRVSAMAGILHADEIDFEAFDVQGELVRPSTALSSSRSMATTKAALGLQRGVVLVDTITTSKAAALAHHEQGDDTQAWRLVSELERRLDRVRDDDWSPSGSGRPA